MPNNKYNNKVNNIFNKQNNFFKKNVDNFKQQKPELEILNETKSYLEIMNEHFKKVEAQRRKKRPG